jgi:hypothetical protein
VKQNLEVGPGGEDIFEGFSGPEEDYEFAWEKDRPKDMKRNDFAYKKCFEYHGDRIKNFIAHQNEDDYNEDKKAFEKIPLY